MTGNPVECVLHPRLWNTTEIWDPLGVGQMYHDEYEEENIGYQIGTVSRCSLYQLKKAMPNDIINAQSVHFTNSHE